MGRARLWIVVGVVALMAACGRPGTGPGPDAGIGDAAGVDPGPIFPPLPAVSLFAGQTRSLKVTAHDPDGDALTYTLGAGPPGWITLAGAELVFAPPPGTTYAGTVTVTASDGHRKATGRVDVAVSPGRITGTVTVDGGAPYTATPDVTVTLAAHSTGGAVTAMAFSNDGATFSGPEPFAAAKAWSLDASSDGPKTVTVRLTDVNGETAELEGHIGLDRRGPSSPGALKLVSVRYHTVTLASPAATDPAPGSGVVGYQVGYRLAGATTPYSYAPATVLGGGRYRVILSAAHTYQVVLRAVDRAGNAGTNLGPIPVTTYFPWTHENRLPTSHAGWPSMSAEVLGGDHFVAGSPFQGEAWIDDADGFATFRRLDVKADAIVPAGASGRALFVAGQTLAFSADLGTTFWPIPLEPPPGHPLVAGAWLGTTTDGAVATDRFIVVGHHQVYLGTVTTRPGAIPRGTLTSTYVPGVVPVDLTAVARCDACAGEVVVGVGPGANIERSADGGHRWTAIAAPAGASYFGDLVGVPGTRRLYASARGGAYTSGDGGLTWTAVPGFAIADESPLAVGGSGDHYTVWAAWDPRVTALDWWDGTQGGQVDLSSLPVGLRSPADVAAVGSGPNASLFYVDGQGGVVDRPGGAAAPIPRSTETVPVIMDLAFRPGSHEDASLVDGTGTVYATHDHGQSFSAEPTGTTSPLYALHVFADGSAVAAGATGALVARDATGTWRVVPTSVADDLSYLDCDPGFGCLLLDDAGGVFHYDRSVGAVTRVLPAGGDVYQGVTVFTDPDGTVHGVLLGTGGNLRTCTGCTTASGFTPEAPIAPGATGSGKVDYLRAVAGRPGGQVVAVGDAASGGVIFTSGDDGVTWTRRAAPPASDYVAVANLPGTSTWYVAGDGTWNLGPVVRSDDDGATWSDVPVYTELSPLTVAVARNPTGISVLVGGNYGQLLYSATGGL